ARPAHGGRGWVGALLEPEPRPTAALVGSVRSHRRGRRRRRPGGGRLRLVGRGPPRGDRARHGLAPLPAVARAVAQDAIGRVMKALRIVEAGRTEIVDIAEPAPPRPG